MAAKPPQAEVPEPVDAPKIERIVISDFRAFPAIQPAHVNVNGCNLLAYGENGSGKSSIYRALRGLFSTTPNDILSLRNVFTDPPQPSVKITLSDNTELHWNAAGHPTNEVRATARRAAFLSHTRLVEMNTGDTPNDPPNLFKVAVERLLADFEVTVAGGGKRSIGELWDNVQKAFAARVIVSGGERRPQYYVRDLQAAIEAFNAAMRDAVGTLETEAKAILRRLLDALSPDALDLIGLTFFDLSYDEATREIRNQSLIPKVRFRDHSPAAHQNFLNEGRQSALAIAIYLAARLVCVPKDERVLKLLVLDDLLISLDYSHRRPVLEVIGELFKGWQIVLLTHDRFWFELAREQLLEQPWKAIEIYEDLDADGMLRPLIRESQNDLVDATLAQARSFLHAKHPAAAANYARAACELALRRYCAKHELKFRYTDEPRKISLEELRSAGAAKAKEEPACEAAFAGILPHQRYVLNPLSHNPAEPVIQADVQAALEAVVKLVEESRKHKPKR